MDRIKQVFFKRVSLLLFLLIVQQSFAQEYSLTLTVTDKESSEPLYGVTVLIDPCACGGITNGSGIFTKRLESKEYNVSIEYLGYRKETLRINLTKNQSINISMEVEEEQLSEIVVLAKKRNQNVESPQMGVFEMSARDLIKIPTAMGEFDVLKSITLLAGVNNSGDISNGVSIRGGSLDQNLMLYESAPVFNPTHLFGLFFCVYTRCDFWCRYLPGQYSCKIRRKNSISSRCKS